MRIFGLTGYPLEHSFSPSYFGEKFIKEGFTDCTYRLYPLDDISKIKPLVTGEPSLEGLNVTIPYKEAVIPYLDLLHDGAYQTGAVNTIKVNRQGGEVKLKGFNTDITGFRASLLPLIRPHHRQALVLGSGGGAKAVIHVLAKLGIEHLIVSREPGKRKITYEELHEDIFKTHPLIVNTTPLGMAPDTSAFPPLPYDLIDDHFLCYDLIYNPEETVFLKKSKACGASVKNGMEMLERQADAAWEIWNNKKT